ncbi:MAG: hypothetical protein GY941_07350 [Planctomycetes bacterium]|nr:hypothetical protein [Planctomycetota bacterium]
MEKSEEHKQCPECAENIKVMAFVCHYCGSTVKKKHNSQEGRFIRVKIMVREKSYTGYIHVDEINSRVSDIVNDNRKFISLSDTSEEKRMGDIKIGYIAFNKSIVDWVSPIEEHSEKEEGSIYRNHDIYF